MEKDNDRARMIATTLDAIDAIDANPAVLIGLDRRALVELQARVAAVRAAIEAEMESRDEKEAR